MLFKANVQYREAIRINFTIICDLEWLSQTFVANLYSAFIAVFKKLYPASIMTKVLEFLAYSICPLGPFAFQPGTCRNRDR